MPAARSTPATKPGPPRPFHPPKPLTTAQAIKVCSTGNCFPVIKGKKYRYPKPSEKEAWTKLINKARLEHAKVQYAVRSGKVPKYHPQRRKFEYILHHKHPDSMKKRAIRNKHRSLHGLQVGDDRHVHHNNQKTMALSSTVVLTPCEHKKMHGQKCKKSKTKAVRILAKEPLKKS
jgi:hypothetical protein